MYLLRIRATAAAEIGEFQARVHVVVVLDEDVLGLQVAVKHAFAVHVCEGTQQLEHVYLHQLRV